MTPKWVPKSEGILGVAPPGAPLVAQPVFGPQKWSPALPKCSQWSKNKPKIIPKSPKIAKKSSKSQAFSGPGLADCAKRLQSAPLLAKGSLGVLRSEARFFLVFDPSKSLPGSSAQSAISPILKHFSVTFFSVPYGAHKFRKKCHILYPISSQNDTQIWEKTLSKPVRKALAKIPRF